MLTSVLLACLFAAEPDLTRFTFHERQMGVDWTLILYAADEVEANRGAKAAFKRVEELNRILSDYDPQSELSKLSETAGQREKVRVGRDLCLVLSRSQVLSEASDGAFDVTVGPLVKLWRRARRTGKLPSEEDLAAARAVVGHELLHLDPKLSTAQLDKPGMKLDLGGIAMGYAVDEALAELRKQGITRVLLDASGDIGLGDPPPDALGWKIGVAPLASTGRIFNPASEDDGAEDPIDARTNTTRYLLLSNAAVTTSGDAFQHVEIGGQRYSHIVDPKTGLGLTDRSSVTVIAADCISADSLATAVSVMGPKAGLRLIGKTSGAAALIVRRPADEIEVFESHGWHEFEIQDAKAGSIKAPR